MSTATARQPSTSFPPTGGHTSTPPNAVLGARFPAAPCGVHGNAGGPARTPHALTQDTGGFFDTELLVLAERAGLSIHEIPVDWIDDVDSRVDILATALADLRGMARLGIGFARGAIKVPHLRGRSPAAPRAGAEQAQSHELPLQIARFTVFGVACTITYASLFLVLL